MPVDDGRLTTSTLHRIRLQGEKFGTDRLGQLRIALQFLTWRPAGALFSDYAQNWQALLLRASPKQLAQM